MPSKNMPTVPESRKNKKRLPAGSLFFVRPANALSADNGAEKGVAVENFGNVIQIAAAGADDF